jgi:hypothetical protein
MKLKVVYNKYIPLKGFVALTLWPWIFVREDKSAKFTQMAKRHEGTHAHQQVECLLVGFLIIYCLEWIIKDVLCGFDSDRSYRSISFEQEAYEHQEEVYYNDVRRHFAWLKYVFTIK